MSTRGVEVAGYNENQNGYLMASIYYYAPSADAYLDQMNELSLSGEATAEKMEELTKKVWGVSRQLMEIVIVEDKKYDELTQAGSTPNDFTYYGNNSEVIGENDGYTYIVAIPDLDYGDLNEEEIAEYLDCKAYMQTVKENLTFIPVKLESNETDVGTQMPVFSSKDINGNTVDNTIFSGKDLTVVNIWVHSARPASVRCRSLLSGQKKCRRMFRL